MRGEQIANVALVSAAFREALFEQPDSFFIPFIAQDGPASIARARELLPSVVEGVATFSHQEVVEMEAPEEAVRQAILETGSPFAEVIADEWTYLATQSWLVAKLATVLDALRDAGADVHEYVRRYRHRLVHELIAAVVPEAHIPDQLTPGTIQRVGIKWVVLGGAALAGHSVLGPLGPTAGLVTRPIVRAFDP